MMVKLFIALSLIGTTHAKMMYNPEKQLYYSTNLKPEHDGKLYHMLAMYACRMINGAYLEDIDVNYTIETVKQNLLVNGSPEADVLYNDIVEVFN